MLAGLGHLDLVCRDRNGTPCEHGLLAPEASP